MTTPEHNDPPEASVTPGERSVPDEGLSPGSEESHLVQTIRRLWDLRERDTAAVAELSVRVEKFEAVFESCWSLIRRLEVKQGDLAKLIAHHGVMIDRLRNTSAPESTPAGSATTTGAADPGASGRSPRPRSTAVREPEQHPANRTPESRTPAPSRWVRFDDFLTDNDHASDRWDPPDW